jgi:hypothetical protein
MRAEGWGENGVRDESDFLGEGGFY